MRPTSSSYRNLNRLKVPDPEGLALIRPYSPTDAVAVMVISKRSPEAAQWTAAGYEQALIAGQTVLVAEAERQVCGFVVARIIDREAEILNLAVEPLERKRGVGSRLLMAVVAEAERHWVERVFLEVRESNRAAIAFYGRYGFLKTGERKKCYKDPLENAVVMEKIITG
jgi:ribosomal-protein-alanine N-acetyltransferase